MESIQRAEYTDYELYNICVDEEQGLCRPLAHAKHTSGYYLCAGYGFAKGCFSLTCCDQAATYGKAYLLLQSDKAGAGLEEKLQEARGAIAADKFRAANWRQQ